MLLIFDGLAREPATEPRPRFLGRLDRLVAEAGAGRLSGRALLAIALGGGALTVMLVAGMTGALTTAIAIGVVVAWLPFAGLVSRRRRRHRRFREAWPDAIATLIAAVRAGVSLPEACSALVERGPEELRDGWIAFTSSYRASARFSTGLLSVRAALADPVADRVVASLLLAHEVGGSDLVRVLRTLGDFVREDMRVRREIEARWSWTVTAARVAAGAPWVVLLLMSTQPEGAAAYNSRAGVITIAAGTGATLIGYRLMLRAARLPEERRLVR